MTTAKDNVGYPYDWAIQDEQAPIDTYWATHRKPRLGDAYLKQEGGFYIQDPGHTHNFTMVDPLDSPWVNGRYALAALVWALIFMLVCSLITSAEASSTAKKKDHPGTKVQAIEQRDSEPKKNCLGVVRVVGSQWNSEAGAEESAQKAWAEHVRFNHGEAYMDWNNALMYQKRCSRSSIGEALGQTLNRCEIEAAPCRPPFTAGTKP